MNSPPCVQETRMMRIFFFDMRVILWYDTRHEGSA